MIDQDSACCPGLAAAPLDDDQAADLAISEVAPG